MSSFVINKCEYVKAAGFCAAMLEMQNYYREPVIRLWNRRENRVRNAEDTYKEFVRLYNINAAAVAEQYHEAEPAKDNAEYRREFNEAKEKTLDLMRRGYTMGGMDDRQKLRRAVYMCLNFFSSARYQIDGDEFTKSALRILNKWYRGFYEVLRKVDGISDESVASWGSFDVFDDPAAT